MAIDDAAEDPTPTSSGRGTQVRARQLSVGRLVLDEVLPLLSVDLESANGAGERVAIIASYGEAVEATLSLAELVRELERSGYFVVVVRASAVMGPLVWPVGMTTNSIVITKPNIGYDFGSWAIGMALFPRLLSAPYVLLVNDSLVGPFESMRPMLLEFEGSDCDVWGVTNTTQILPHLQSYVLGFKDGILLDPSLKAFWSEVQVLEDKDSIIANYEVGLSRLLHEEGFISRAWFDSSVLVEEGLNPSLWGWRRLIGLGFPFVKRQLVTLPELVLDGQEIPGAIRHRFGINLNDWI